MIKVIRPSILTTNNPYRLRGQCFYLLPAMLRSTYIVLISNNLEPTSTLTYFILITILTRISTKYYIKIIGKRKAFRGLKGLRNSII